MRRPLASVVSLLVVLLASAVPVQTKQDCLITINSDGTCDAAGLHVRCSVIGPSLRQAARRMRASDSSPVQLITLSSAPLYSR
jgi:hypothetical protein